MNERMNDIYCTEISQKNKVAIASKRTITIWECNRSEAEAQRGLHEAWLHGSRNKTHNELNMNWNSCRNITSLKFNLLVKATIIFKVAVSLLNAFRNNWWSHSLLSVANTHVLINQACKLLQWIWDGHLHAAQHHFSITQTNNKCIGDETKGVARRSPNYIRKKYLL